MELFADQVTFGFVVAFVLEALKKNKYFPFLKPEHTANYKRFVAFFAALISTIGVHYTFDPEARVLAIAIPTFGQFAHGIYELIKQLVFQQAAYRGLIENKSPKN
jgi:hypothetical protein